MAEKRRSPCTLSVKAHAFSVEALIGSEKRRKLGEDDTRVCFLEEVTEVLELPSNGGEREERACNRASDRGSEIECVSDGSLESCDVLLESPHPEAQAQRAPTVTVTVPGEEMRVDLQGSDLWKRFHEIGTEMIITKAGRRMFPAMRVKISGLDPHQLYYITMDIIPVDNKRYRYVYHSSKWMVAGNADSPVPPRVYIHPDSPASGETWMRQVISFDKLKLTNNELDDQGHIILHSMHKYQPRVHVIHKERGEELSHVRAVPQGDGTRTLSFPETTFTTVTAYQNQQITRLKIDRNPFAKGFRDSGRNRMGLEALVESYAFWRPSLRSLTFEDISGIKQGAPGAHGGVGSPHLLSSSPCSSPFQVWPLSPPDYTCSRPTHTPLHRYSNLPEPFPSPTSRGPSAYDSEGFCSMSLPPSQIGYLQNPAHQGYGSLRLHSPPYGLYGYAFPPSPRLIASPDKMAAASAAAANQNPFLGSSPNGTLADSLGMLSGGQQANFLFDSRTLGMAGSQSGGGASQVTTHMG
ncbi:T-box transcription factor TBX18 [Oncorhynchus kisutch]|uniref:T-box transcription factor 18 n=1 Tax=Oncorhynchus kisutch TaxID=8019 RepID=A0A8C7CX18_ONCKI|nr:T-box transcription factor TBX18-like [Oncorhynchus kisutch]